MADEAYWQYEVDSVQRHGTTAATKARRHGEVSRPDAADGKAPNQPHSEKGGEDGFDDDGIPTGI
jgi:hypothetical protein